MNLALILATFMPPTTSLTTVSFTANGTWTAPGGVSLVTTITGKGADGTSGTSGYYDSPTNRAATGEIITGVSGNYGGAGAPGRADWSSFAGDPGALVSMLNAGGSGSYNQITILQYDDVFISRIDSVVSYSDVVVGSASYVLNSGWKFSGAIQSSDFGFCNLYWQEAVYHPGTSPTTGASSTGLGKTFVGGSPTAVSSSYSNVAVVAGTAYPIVVPAGGSITITY